MELNNNLIIQFVNVENNETFVFPVIIVKGRILGNVSNCVADAISVYELDGLGNILKKRFFKLEEKNFYALLRLKAGNNDFVFRFETAEVKQTFHHVSSSAKFVVSPVLIICEGEEIPYSRVEIIKNKIHIGCSLIQTLVAEILYEHGFGRKTFVLEKGDDNNENGGDGGCLVFRSKLNVRAIGVMNSEELWEYFGREIMTSEHGLKHRKFVSFVSRGQGKISQNLAIGGGGLALCSVEYVRTWPSCVDETDNYFNNANDTKNLLSASLGAVCHELCHTFDLGHTTGGIMGQDFDRVGIVFSCARCTLPTPTARKLENISCARGEKDSLIVHRGSVRRKLRINYSINCHVSLPSSASNICDVTGEQSTKFDRDHILSAVSFLSAGCASLLAYHKWINQSCCGSIRNVNVDIGADSCLRYDTVRSIVTSTFGLVLIQLRNHDGYVLKSWKFLENKTKTLFLVPICESRKADFIVIQDIKGNLLKKNVQHYLTNFCN